jgi:hypothetical protein
LIVQGTTPNDGRRISGWFCWSIHTGAPAVR